MTTDTVTELFDLTEQLCAIPSVSGSEQALADFVEQWLRDHAHALTIERLADNVVARPLGSGAAAGRDGAPRIVLGGHLDTVPANGNLTPRRDGATLHGLGSADMKGGLAIMLHLARRLAQDPARHDATFVFYEGEEVADEHNGLRFLFAEHPELVAGDLAILLEPTGGWLEAGCQGTIHIRAAFEGTRAHTARPWMGVNAIHRATRFLARCAGFEPEVVDVDGLEYREALQVVRISGGVANNVVPDACELVVNRRIAPCAHDRARDQRLLRAARRCRHPRGTECLSARAAESLASARAGVDRCRCARRAPEAGVDRRCTVRGARDRRVQLRPG